MLAGDFQAGRVTIANILRMKSLTDGHDDVVTNEVDRIETIATEARIARRLSGLAAGGLVGSIAGGAIIGGIFGPLGSFVGGASGALLAGRNVIVRRVLLRDGRYFIASGSKAAWATLEAILDSEPATRRPLSQTAKSL